MYIQYLPSVTCKHLISIPLVCSLGSREFNSYLLPAHCLSPHLSRPTLPTLVFIKVCVRLCVHGCVCLPYGLKRRSRSVNLYQETAGVWPLFSRVAEGTERLAGWSEDEHDFVILAKARELERHSGLIQVPVRLICLGL